jgi:hypothetical protein
MVGRAYGSRSRERAVFGSLARRSLVALGLVLGLSACVDRAEVVEIIVPFREGGGSDQWARTLAPYLQRYLGDSLTVQVVNVLGASGVQGGNEFALRRPPDARSLFVTSGSQVFPYLLGEPAVRYDFDDFRGIVGSPVGGVVYASAETGIRSVEDLCSTDTLLVYGGISPTGLDMVPLLTFELLGLDVLSILGYSGKGASRVAFEQGETNLDYQTSPAYLANVVPLIEEGRAVPLYSFGMLDENGEVVDDPVFEDLPGMKSAYRICHGRDPGGVEWEVYRAVLVAGFAAQKNLWVHDEAPEDRVLALVEAARRAVNDAEFLRRAERLLGGYDFYLAGDVDRALEATARISPQAMQWLVDFLVSEFDVRLPEPRSD